MTVDLTKPPASVQHHLVQADLAEDQCREWLRAWHQERAEILAAAPKRRRKRILKLSKREKEGSDVAH